MHNDILPGGKADDKCSSNFDQDALQQGIDVELEHTDDPEIAEEIATDHLDEDDDYYDKLAEMEAGALDEINDQECDRYEDPIKYGATAWDESKHPQPAPPADPPKPKVQKQLFRKSWREQKDNGQKVEYTLYAEVVDE